MGRAKETIESKNARTRIKRNALSYITDLEDLRKIAKNNGDLRLATDITIRLLEHAIGKPRERKEIDADIGKIVIEFVEAKKGKE